MDEDETMIDVMIWGLVIWWSDDLIIRWFDGMMIPPSRKYLPLGRLWEPNGQKYFYLTNTVS